MKDKEKKPLLLDETRIQALDANQKKMKIIFFASLMVSICFFMVCLGTFGYKPMFNLESKIYFGLNLFFFALFLIHVIVGVFLEKKTPVFRHTYDYWIIIGVTLLVFALLYPLNFLTTKYQPEDDFINLNFPLYILISFPVMAAYLILLQKFLIRPFQKKQKNH